MKEPQGECVRAWPGKVEPLHHGIGVRAGQGGGMAEINDRPGRAPGGGEVDPQRELADDRLRGEGRSRETKHDSQGRSSTHEFLRMCHEARERDPMPRTSSRYRRRRREGWTRW